MISDLDIWRAATMVNAKLETTHVRAGNGVGGMRFRPSRQPTSDIAAEPAGYLMKPRGRAFIRFLSVWLRKASGLLPASTGKGKGSTLAAPREEKVGSPAAAQKRDN
jgi:hypothetical protein